MPLRANAATATAHRRWGRLLHRRRPLVVRRTGNWWRLGLRQLDEVVAVVFVVLVFVLVVFGSVCTPVAVGWQRWLTTWRSTLRILTSMRLTLCLLLWLPLSVSAYVVALSLRTLLGCPPRLPPCLLALRGAVLRRRRRRLALMLTLVPMLLRLRLLLLLPAATPLLPAGSARTAALVVATAAASVFALSPVFWTGIAVTRTGGTERVVQRGLLPARQRVHLVQHSVA